MNGSPKINIPYFKIFVIVCIVLLAGAIAWVYSRVDNSSSNQASEASKTSTKPASDQVADTSTTRTLKSGKGGFSITLPKGWGDLSRATDDDAFAIIGKKQPDVRADSKISVTDVKTLSGDSALVFATSLLDKNTATAPQGASEAFSIGKGGDERAGKKYTYIYTKDELTGVGTQRFQSDRDYTYVIPADNNKELVVWYNVYGSDPRNQVEIVDDIVRSITF